ncbi:ribonuclease HI family protein [Methanolobus sp. ZRKC2]|uniref:ribonuclease HI family protein n=1 Tax=Methanolobus sp. ZRKC2 TaxID=3125783 RepID=UPI00325265FF
MQRITSCVRLKTRTNISTRDMDLITFDGSCSPNPGGCMGVGWVVTLQNNSHSILGNDRLDKKNSNSALFAEYLALKKGMLEYVNADGQGPLTVIGDSQTVIYQMRGIYPIENHEIRTIYEDISSIIRQYELDIYFRWVPRIQNQKADRLSKSKQKVHMEYPNDRKCIIDIDIAPVSNNLRRKISSMNSTPFPTVKMLKRLHPGSKDLFSEMELPELREMAGKYAAEKAANEFPGKTDRSKYFQAQSLRWMLRGLAVDLSIHKVRFDSENKNNSKKSRKKKKNQKNTNASKSAGGRSKYYLNRRSFAF